MSISSIDELHWCAPQVKSINVFTPGAFFPMDKVAPNLGLEVVQRCLTPASSIVWFNRMEIVNLTSHVWLAGSVTAANRTKLNNFILFGHFRGILSRINRSSTVGKESTAALQMPSLGPRVLHTFFHSILMDIFPDTLYAHMYWSVCCVNCLCVLLDTEIRWIQNSGLRLLCFLYTSRHFSNPWASCYTSRFVLTYLQNTMKTL